MKSVTDTEEIKKIYADLRHTQSTDEEKYRYLMKNDPDVIYFKKEIMKKVEERGLGLYMNDTKWLELQKGVHSLPFPPAYFEKLISDKKFTYDINDIANMDAPTFHGDWTPFYNEGMPIFFDIEYLIVVPRYRKDIGRLVKGRIIDIVMLTNFRYNMFICNLWCNYVSQEF